MQARFDSLNPGQSFTKRFWNGWVNEYKTFQAVSEPITNRRTTVVEVQNPNGGVILLHGKPWDYIETHD